MERLRAGKDYKTIGYELRISEGTARVHGSAALRKLGKSRLSIKTQDAAAT